MQPVRLIAFITLAGCGAAEPAAVSPDPVTPVEPSRPVDEGGELAELDGAACASDADCVVGGMAQCCVSHGAGCEEAWSRTAWAEHQARCATEECDRVRMMSCTPRSTGEPTAACVDHHCVLR
jgi:hypothetical protein